MREVGGRITLTTLPDVFLGQDLLAYLVLAIGGAMAVGSIAALVRPPTQRSEGDLEQAPVARSLVFAADRSGRRDLGAGQPRRRLSTRAVMAAERSSRRPSDTSVSNGLVVAALEVVDPVEGRRSLGGGGRDHRGEPGPHVGDRDLGPLELRHAPHHRGVHGG